MGSTVRTVGASGTTSILTMETVHDTEAETSSLAYAQEAKRLYWTGAGQPRSTTLR